MPARSLLAMSTRVAIQNVRSLTDIGNIPYSLARPFLLKVESPNQLRELEKNSPHIMQEDQELWMEFIKRDIPRWDQYDLPQESDCWYDVYCDIFEQVHREVEEGALQLKQAVDKFYSDKASNAAVLVKDTNRLPKPRRRFQSSRVTTEPKKNRIFRTNRNKVLAVPTHRLNTGASRINHVPQWLVDEHKQDTPSLGATRKRPADSSSASKSMSASDPSSAIQPFSNGRSTQGTGHAAKPRMARPSSTSVAKTPIIPRSQTSAPPKRSLEGTPLPSQGGHSESPRALPPTSPPGRPLVRKRPLPTQPNVFIQPKKRRA